MNFILGRGNGRLVLMRRRMGDAGGSGRGKITTRQKKTKEDETRRDTR